MAQVRSTTTLIVNLFINSKTKIIYLFLSNAGAEEARQRYSQIRDAFVQKFNAEPEVFARSPGNINKMNTFNH
jgi:hypothetical protein